MIPSWLAAQTRGGHFKLNPIALAFNPLRPQTWRLACCNAQYCCPSATTREITEATAGNFMQIKGRSLQPVARP